MAESGRNGRREAPQSQVLLRFLNGSPAAVARVASTMRRVVRGGAYSIPESEHEDLIQESVLHAYRACSAPGFALRSDFDSFVCSIAYRRCIDWLRRQRVTTSLNPETAGHGEPPDESLALKETISLGRQILDRISDACRELMRLRMSDDLPYRAIAERLRTTEGAVRTRMYRCLAEARTIVEDLGRAGDLPAAPKGR
jgi:RNA polymerase sigma factor (sigma-70 family)